jgi:hypothetical protein
MEAASVPSVGRPGPTARSGRSSPGRRKAGVRCLAGGPALVFGTWWSTGCLAGGGREEAGDTALGMSTAGRCTLIARLEATYWHRHQPRSQSTYGRRCTARSPCGSNRAPRSRWQFRHAPPRISTRSTPRAMKSRRDALWPAASSETVWSTILRALRDCRLVTAARYRYVARIRGRSPVARTRTSSSIARVQNASRGLLSSPSSASPRSVAANDDASANGPARRIQICRSFGCGRSPRPFPPAAVRRRDLPVALQAPLAGSGSAIAAGLGVTMARNRAHAEGSEDTWAGERTTRSGRARMAAVTWCRSRDSNSDALAGRGV